MKNLIIEHDNSVESKTISNATVEKLVSTGNYEYFNPMNEILLKYNSPETEISVSDTTAMFSLLCEGLQKIVKKSDESGKQIIISGLYMFLTFIKASDFCKTYVESILSPLSFLVVGCSEDKNFVKTGFEKIDYNPKSDFFVDLVEKLDENSSDPEFSIIVRSIGAFKEIVCIMENYDRKPSSMEMVTVKNKFVDRKFSFDNIMVVLSDMYEEGRKDIFKKFLTGELCFVMQNAVVTNFLKTSKK